MEDYWNFVANYGENFTTETNIVTKETKAQPDGCITGCKGNCKWQDVYSKIKEIKFSQGTVVKDLTTCVWVTQGLAFKTANTNNLTNYQLKGFQ